MSFSSGLFSPARMPRTSALGRKWTKPEPEYVSMRARMGLTAAPSTNATAALRLIPRSMHYLTKPSLQAMRIVKKLGHRSGSRKVPGGGAQPKAKRRKGK